MNEVDVFIRRMKRIGLELELVGNVPYIYLNRVNGNKVQFEDYNVEHGYVIAWCPVRLDQRIHLDSDIKRTFEIIRKYR
jgi:hypothetical protein